MRLLSPCGISTHQSFISSPQPIRSCERARTRLRADCNHFPLPLLLLFNSDTELKGLFHVLSSCAVSSNRSLLLFCLFCNSDEHNSPAVPGSCSVSSIADGIRTSSAALHCAACVCVCTPSSKYAQRCLSTYSRPIPIRFDT